MAEVPLEGLARTRREGESTGPVAAGEAFGYLVGGLKLQQAVRSSPCASAGSQGEVRLSSKACPWLYFGNCSFQALTQQHMVVLQKCSQTGDH